MSNKRIFHQQGELSLDDPLNKFFPEFPNWAGDITIRHLVHLISGIRDYLTLSWLAGSVVTEPFNADKTTRLETHVTTLVAHMSEIEGFTTAIAPTQTTLQDRLDALDAEETAAEVRIRLPGSILFDFDSAAIRPDAQRTLGEVLEVIQAYAGSPVRVEGHTDSIASDDYNQQLSEQRAASVVDWLAAHGVELARLETVAWGESRPLGDNDTAEGRQQNRRVEVIIEKG